MDERREKTKTKSIDFVWIIFDRLSDPIRRRFRLFILQIRNDTPNEIRSLSPSFAVHQIEMKTCPLSSVRVHTHNQTHAPCSECHLVIFVFLFAFFFLISVTTRINKSNFKVYTNFYCRPRVERKNVFICGLAGDGNDHWNPYLF